MKNRILSAILAVVMVVSMAALFTVGASADGATYTLTLGTAEIVAGQTAYVDVTLASTGMDSGLHIREWQITLSGDFTVSEANSTFYGDGTVYSFANESQKIVGASVAKGGNLGTAAQVNAGFKLATLALTATADTTVTATVDVLTTEASDNTTRTPVQADTTPVAGAISVYVAKAVPQAVVDGQNVYFVGRIATAIAADYEKVGLQIVFGAPANRTFTKCDKTSVSRTVIGVASTNETTASQQGILFVEGGDLVCLTSAVIKGVPAGTYEVTVSVLLDDGTGAAVVGDATTMTVVVE